ncbi:CBS domain-containing protein [Salegentibacter sp. JZCK2]|uniref:magnesium transporter MgtE N-terminal domain-containing protein n=1 Tax=Salegentibacter tibetensis TaxID=2873600 RepID=UPI001CCE94B8|nr:CBS domain-containing protein [Salegentibacter tibetensis]MBZ9730182.1 CBS domain-containing protein [Salegentibacter tibetensis]
MDTDERILEAFIHKHGRAATQILEKLEPEEVASLLREIPVELAAKILEPMYAYKASRILESLDHPCAIKILEEVDLKTAELILRQMEGSVRNSLLKDLTPKVSGPLRLKLKNPENTVGALMDPILFTLRKSVKVSKALTFLKEHQRLVSPYVFVVNQDKSLHGVVNLQDLLLADKDAPLTSLANTNVPKLYDDVHFETVINYDSWLYYYALPVTDRFGVLVGSLRLEAVRRGSVESEEVLGKQAIKAGAALGELYRIGLTGFLRSPGE